MNNEKSGHGQKEQFPVTINEKTFFFDHAKVTGKALLEKANLLPITCYTLYQKLKNCDFEKIGLDEVIDLSNKEIEHFITKEPDVFHYTVDKEPEMTDKKKLTPVEILQLAGKRPHEFYIVQLLADDQKFSYAFQPDAIIKMLCSGMDFITGTWVTEVDIEEYGKQCKEVPPAHHYKIRIDKDHYIVKGPVVTGKQLIELTKKTPVSHYDVFAFYSNQPKPKKIGLDEEVDLLQKCLIRFVLQPREQKDGREMRKHFTLPVEDIDFLNQMGLEWECISEGSLWLLIYGYPMPKGYQVTEATVGLQIVPNYPAVEIDMAYFHPMLQKNSGHGINATTPQMIDGKTYQRWSRHRQPGEWKPGVDNLCTHLSLVDNWLLNDLNR